MHVRVCNFPVDVGVRAHDADRVEGRSTISVVWCLVQRVVLSVLSRARERARVVLVVV